MNVANVKVSTLRCIFDNATEHEMLDGGFMNEEPHIIASACETQFTVKGEFGSVEFSSLVAAARHVRASSSSTNGFVVIDNEHGKAMSRIPFRVAD